MTPLFRIPSILQVVEHDDSRESGYMGLRAAQEARFFEFLPEYAREEYELVSARVPSSFVEIDNLPAPPCEFYQGEELLTEVEIVADAICDLDSAILVPGLPSDADGTDCYWDTRPDVTMRNRGLRNRMWKETLAERAAERNLRNARNEIRALYSGAIIAADELRRKECTLSRIKAEIRKTHVRAAQEQQKLERATMRQERMVKKEAQHQAAFAANVPTRDDINRLRRELPSVKFAFGGGISPNSLKGQDLVEIWVALFTGRNEGEFQGAVAEFLNAVRYSLGKYTVVVAPGESVRVRIIRRKEDANDRSAAGRILEGRTNARGDSRAQGTAAS